MKPYQNSPHSSDDILKIAALKDLLGFLMLKQI